MREKKNATNLTDFRIFLFFKGLTPSLSPNFKKLLILTMFLLAINVVSADLIISPNPIPANVLVSVPEDFTITVTNTHPFQIHNISFTPLTGISFPEQFSLEINESKDIIITIETDTQESTTISSTVSFFFLSDITNDEQTYQINITETGFSPIYQEIKQLDSITWNNQDTISHTISGTGINQIIAPNESFTFQFPNIGIEIISDDNFPYTHIIEVKSNTEAELIHNGNFDKILNINLNSLYDTTTLDLSLLTNNFNITNGESNEGVLQITNSGSDLASNIEISSTTNWITFSETSFNLETGQNKFITFTLSPDFQTRNETDKTYLIPINIKATNTEQYSKEVNVYIPFDNSISQFSGITNFDEITALLNYYYNLFQQANNSNVNNSQGLIFGNFTWEEVRNNLRVGTNINDRITNVERSNTNNAGLLKQILDKITLMESNQNTTNTNYEKQINKADSTLLYTWLGLLAISFGGFLYLFYQLDKKKKSKEFSILTSKGKKVKEFEDLLE